MTNSKSRRFFLHLRAYQVSAVDMLAYLVTIKVDIALGEPFCFFSTLAIWPRTIVVILAFS